MMRRPSSGKAQSVWKDSEAAVVIDYEVYAQRPYDSELLSHPPLDQVVQAGEGLRV